ncbi:MAG: hypothetical protein KF830_16040 [Planctomycetes bacterium]|nr:hypothetical protein [Planctomycetota bacterium]
MRRTLLPCAIAASAAALTGQSWQQLNPTASPSVRRAGAMAFDATANRLILHGGLLPAPADVLNETWSWNGTTWTLLNPVGGSPPRWGHQLVRDTAQNRLITFGGRSPTINSLASDTYAWTGSAWSLVPTPNSPPARFRYGLAYDSRRNRVVLFGGRGLTQVFADTWEFNGITWTQAATPLAPPPREDMVMAYDAGLARTVLFGGYDPATDTVRGDTWEWDGSVWQPRAIDGGPGPRFRAAGIFDSFRQRIVMYGGFDGGSIRNETWEYAGGAWNQVSAVGTPFATEMYAGYDSQRRRFATFGGVGSEFSDDTWEYTGATTGALGTFGIGCPTSVGIAFPTAPLPPRINSTYTIEWQNLPVTTPAVIIVHGVSNTQWNGVPLPFELTVLDLAGCNLLVSADLVGIEAAAGGNATTTLTIPNTPAFVSTSIYSQILIPDPAAFNAVGGASIGARSLLGS